MLTALPTFIIDALIAGSLLAVLAGVLGPFVVSGRQSVASDMLAHLALAGVGIGVVAGILPTHGALLVLLLASVLLWALLRYGRIAPDALAMFFLTGGLAVALICIHMARNSAVSFESFLFGSILTVSSQDILEMSLITILALGFIISNWYRLLGAVQIPEYFEPYRNRASLFHLAFLLLLATVVWIGLTTVGGLLVGALLVIPVLVARPFVHSFGKLVIGSCIVSLASVWSGIMISLYIDVPTSSAIVLSVIGLFALCIPARHAYMRWLAK
jgi:zinc transport system permease protein